MTAADQTTYTCDRCGIVAVVDSHKPNGERNGMPIGWRHIDVRGYLAGSGDLCGQCADGYCRWFREGASRVA